MTNLKYMRKKRYRHACELARILSVSDVAVYRWEHGKMPSEDNKAEIERIFGEKIEFLLKERET